MEKISYQPLNPHLYTCDYESDSCLFANVNLWTYLELQCWGGPIMNCHCVIRWPIQLAPESRQSGHRTAIGNYFFPPLFPSEIWKILRNYWRGGTTNGGRRLFRITLISSATNNADVNNNGEWIFLFIYLYFKKL